MKKVFLLFLCFILSFTSVYSEKSEGSMYGNIVINEIMASNSEFIKDVYDEYSDWIELHNLSLYDVDISGCYLSDGKKNLVQYKIPDGVIVPANGYIIVWCTGNEGFFESQCYTNFKVSEGETVYFTDRDGTTIIDSLKAKDVSTDESIGRTSPNSDDIAIFSEPTPYKSNIGAKKKIKPPVFSKQAGVYENEFNLELTADEGADVYFTLDGSIPDENSMKYTTPIRVASRVGEPNTISMIPTNTLDTNRAWKLPQGEVYKSNVVRACAIVNGEKSEVVTSTYFVDKEFFTRYGVNVVSIATDEENLFDFNKGIYVAGGNLNYQKEGREWEREASFEYFDKNGKLELAQNIGIRIHGAFSTNFPQKSLRIYARSEYGKKEFNYKFFEDNDVKKFKSLIVRNSGNDFGNLMFLDAMYQSLWKDNISAIIQDAKPAVLFINGEYWGISNIREHYSEEYFAQHFGGDENNYIIAENGGLVIDTGVEGDKDTFKSVANFAASSDMNVSENYDKVEKWVDLDNMATYFVAQIFAGNNDWPGNNLGLFRYKVNPIVDGANVLDGRWRFFIKDVDQAYAYKMINFSVIEAIKNGEKGNYPVKLFLSMLKSEKFKNKFLVAFCDAINTNLSRESIYSAATKNKEIYRELIEEHIARWGSPESFSAWEKLVDGYKSFGNRRVLVVKNQIEELVGDIGDFNSNLCIGVNNSEYGKVLLNSTYVDDFDSGSVKIENNSIDIWKGKYFEGANITLTAIPNDGYKFVGWELGYASSSDKINVTLKQGDNIYFAKFAPLS